MMSETQIKTTEEIQNVTSEEVESVMTKDEFVKVLFTDKRFKFIPNKKAIVKKIRTMDENEYKKLIQQAFGQMK
jgi:hypothetical protein